MASMIANNTTIPNASSRVRFSGAAVALLALGLSATSCPAFAQSTPVDRFDVLGVKINMPLVDARKALGSALAQPVTETCDSVAAYKDGPALRTRCLLHDGRPTVDQAPNTVTQMMTGGGGQGWFHMTEKVDLDLSGTNGAERVVFVSRGKAFPKGQEPTIDKVVEGLKQKYGETTSTEVRNQYGTLMTWIYDLQGQLIIREQTPRWLYQCDISSKANDMSAGQPGSTSWTTFNAPPTLKDVAQGCGFAVVAEVNSIYGNPQIAGSFTTMMVDQTALYNALVGRDKYLKAALQAKQDNDAKNAKGDVKY
jgi:hypothetical protein